MTEIVRNIPFIRDQWIPALRSGAYRQGRDRLYANDQFCCLGVAGDLLIKSGVIPDRWIYFDALKMYALDYDTAKLSERVRNVIGITEDEHDILANLNDANDSTFPKIADYIEAHILTADGAQ